jgi:cardiolipin synthase A/B
MQFLDWAFLAVVPLVALLSAAHALLHKRDPRAALGWIAVCLLFPLAGPVLYFLFGINRVRTRARQLDWHAPMLRRLAPNIDDPTAKFVASRHQLSSAQAVMARVSDSITRRPLVSGNAIELLHNGEQAYPAMLEAIANARRSIFLITYIFDTDKTGKRFIHALAAAVQRGLDVRVLIDGVGEYYGLPRAGTLLRKQGDAH